MAPCEGSDALMRAFMAMYQRSQSQLNDYIAKRDRFLKKLKEKLEDRTMSSSKLPNDDRNTGKIEFVHGGSYPKGTQVKTPAKEYDDFDILVVFRSDHSYRKNDLQTRHSDVYLRMLTKVAREVASSLGMTHEPKRTPPSVTVKYESKTLSFDLLPALRVAGDYVVPGDLSAEAGGSWEPSPTDSERQWFLEMRAADSTLIPVIRTLKFLGRAHSWDISSFVLETVVLRIFVAARDEVPKNHLQCFTRNLLLALKKLRKAMGNGLRHPFTGETLLCMIGSLDVEDPEQLVEMAARNTIKDNAGALTRRLVEAQCAGTPGTQIVTRLLESIDEEPSK